MLRVVHTSLDDFAALLPAPPPQAASLEDMEAAIGEALEEKALDSRTA